MSGETTPAGAPDGLADQVEKVFTEGDEHEMLGQDVELGGLAPHQAAEFMKGHPARGDVPGLNEQGAYDATFNGIVGSNYLDPNAPLSPPETNYLDPNGGHNEF